MMAEGPCFVTKFEYQSECMELVAPELCNSLSECDHVISVNNYACPVFECIQDSEPFPTTTTTTTTIPPSSTKPLPLFKYEPYPQHITCLHGIYTREEKFEPTTCVQLDFSNFCDLCVGCYQEVELVGPTMCQVWSYQPTKNPMLPYIISTGVGSKSAFTSLLSLKSCVIRDFLQLSAVLFCW